MKQYVTKENFPCVALKSSPEGKNIKKTENFLMLHGTE